MDLKEIFKRLILDAQQAEQPRILPRTYCVPQAGNILPGLPQSSFKATSILGHKIFFSPVVLIPGIT